MAARGVPVTTVNGWYRDRARTGHPEKAGRIGRTDYWYDDEWTAWHQAHQRGKAESLTEVDRDGDPDDLVDAAEAARMLRYANRYVIHANRRLGYFPEPDAYAPASRGRPSPLWKRSTVWAAADARPGKIGGHKPGTPGAPRKPHPYAGDERLARVLAGLRSGTQPSATDLATEWNVSRRTAERIVTAARALIEEERADLDRNCPVTGMSARHGGSEACGGLFSFKRLTARNAAGVASEGRFPPLSAGAYGRADVGCRMTRISADGWP